MARSVILAAFLGLMCVLTSSAVEPASLDDQLRNFNGNVIVLGKVRRPPLASMLPNYFNSRLREANHRENDSWAKVKTRADWDAFLKPRLQALRESLGTLDAKSAHKPTVRVVGTHKGDGYTVDNILYESVPGLWVTANLYRPAQPGKQMPGLVIIHSHIRPKHNGQRQDMGMTWARAGCLVLIPDLVGTGERRQHDFATPDDFPKPFSSSQDYYFRYDLGIQLDLVGQTLMGWFIRDLMRGIDVLLEQPGIAAKKIAVVSEPAGGGDVAGVLAAVDPRVACAVVTNFGGPEPESSYPLPPDADKSFNYSGSGSWESTRSLRGSARGGFLPWVILAATAPRRLVYNHEFYWDEDNDPVWRRLRKAYDLNKARESLAGVAGFGFVVGSAPENSHWIPINREKLYPLFERWLGVKNPGKEYSKQLPEADLLCLNDKLRNELKPRKVHEIARHLAHERIEKKRKLLAGLSSQQRRETMRRDWTALLGDTEPKGKPKARRIVVDETLPGVTAERIHLSTEPGIVLPVLLLKPAKQDGALPMVIGVAQAGKQAFLRERADTIAGLLKNNVAVCLPDLRGCGETEPGEGRTRRSSASSLSSTAQMLGTPLVGSRLRDLRGVIKYLRTRDDLDGKRLALWGDSFAPVNPADTKLSVPRALASRPHEAEPLGGLLALLGALFDKDIQAVYIRGGLASYASILDSAYTYVPHDSIVAGVFSAGDLADLAGALAPTPLRLDGLVDGQDRLVSEARLQKMYAPALAAHGNSKASLIIDAKPTDPTPWLLESLKGKRN